MVSLFSLDLENLLSIRTLVASIAKNLLRILNGKTYWCQYSKRSLELATFLYNLLNSVDSKFFKVYISFKTVPDHDHQSFSYRINNVFGIDCTLKKILFNVF